MCYPETKVNKDLSLNAAAVFLAILYRFLVNHFLYLRSSIFVEYIAFLCTLEIMVTLCLPCSATFY